MEKTYNPEIITNTAVNGLKIKFWNSGKCLPLMSATTPSW